MRIEYMNTITGKGGAVDLPPKLNPVWIGNHPRSHVVLESPMVGPEAGAFDNDVAGGDGWRFWNRNGKPIKVGDTALTELNQHVLIREPRVTVECWPYVLTASFTADEMATGKDDADRLDRGCADIVRQVHKALVDLHPNDSSDRAEWLRDGYIHDLERQIALLAAERSDFPADGLTTTELGAHLAGIAVRSALIQALVASDRGGRPAAGRAESPWTRFRGALPDAEAELAGLVREAEAALSLEWYEDLSDKVVAVESGFWPFWHALVAAGRAGPQSLRYLALRRLVKEIKDVWYGYGPLEDLLDDPTVSEIMVINADQIFIEKNGFIERSGRRFLTDPVTIIQRLLATANRQINAAQPLADARMPDGSRVNAIIGPLALSGPCLTIRRFPPHRLTVANLVASGALSRAAAAFLEAAVINRRSTLVSGATGTGKTTMLNCLSGFIPPKERIVTIEDTAELQLQKDHVVTLQARPRNTEGAGTVSIRELVRNALRMRPDRIVVGECRGGEAIDMLQAMNTGHNGSMTTIHANNPADVVLRLETIAQDNPDIRLPVESIRQQIVSAIDVIVQLDWVVRGGRKTRVVTEIAEVVAFDPEDAQIRIVPLFRRNGNGPLVATGFLPTFLPDLIADGLVPDPVAFVRGDADCV